MRCGHQAGRPPLAAAESGLEDERAICPLLSQKVPSSRGESPSSSQSSGERLRGRGQRSLVQGSHPQGHHPQWGGVHPRWGGSILSRGSILSGAGPSLVGGGPSSVGGPLLWQSFLSPLPLPLGVGAGSLSEPDLLLLPSRTGWDTSTHTLTEKAITHVPDTLPLTGPRAFYGETWWPLGISATCQEPGKKCLSALPSTSSHTVLAAGAGFTA